MRQTLASSGGYSDVLWIVILATCREANAGLQRPSKQEHLTNTRTSHSVDDQQQLPAERKRALKSRGLVILGKV